MGVHFTVIADHDIRDTSLDSIRGRFAKLNSAFEQVGTELSLEGRLESRGWKDMTEPGSQYPDHYSAPAGFSVLIGRSALKFHHNTRFSVFAEHGVAQTSLRRFSRDLVGLFRNRAALYAPCEGIGDDIAEWITDGLSLAEIEARLRMKGAPAESLVDLGNRRAAVSRCFIDTFEDLADR